MAPTIVIAAGGTAGHVVPALAVADALRAEGAHVVFVGGERAERTMVPDGRLRAAPDRRRGAEPQQPAEGRPRGAAAPPARSARRGGSCATCAPTRCSAAAATSPGRSGSPRCARRVPLVLTEADSHLGLTNRLLARWARRVCLAFPIAGRDGERYLRHRAPGAAAGDRSRRGPRALRPRPRTSTCVLVFGGSLGARTINEAAVAGARRRRLPRPARLRDARLRGAARAARARSAGQLRPARVHHARSARRCWPATCASRAPAARSSRSPPTGARRSSCPTRTRRPTTRPPTRAGWPQAGAAVVVADAELTPAAAGAARSARCWAIARGWRRWGGRRRRWRGPTPLSGSPPRCCAAAR